MKKALIALGVLVGGIAIAQSIPPLRLLEYDSRVGTNCAANGSTVLSQTADAGVTAIFKPGRAYFFQTTDERACVCWGSTNCTAATGVCLNPGEKLLLTARANSAKCVSAGATGDVKLTPQE